MSFTVVPGFKSGVSLMSKFYLVLSQVFEFVGYRYSLTTDFVYPLASGLVMVPSSREKLKISLTNVMKGFFIYQARISGSVLFRNGLGCLGWFCPK